MKKQDFLNAVRLGLVHKPHDSLKKLIMEFARLIPRDGYEEALELLDKNSMVIVKSTSVDLPNTVKQLCESVENGEYEFVWEYEHGYYDGYYSDDDVLTDKDGLGEEIQGLLEVVVDYVKEKRYSEALFAFDELFSLAIPVEDYDEDIDIHTLFSNNLINLEISEVLHYYAYTALMALRGGERVRKLYDVAAMSRYSIKIQEVVGVGADDIPDRKEFAGQWIDFLSAQNLDRREHILIDAVLFGGGIRALHDFTMERGAKYQSAYVRLSEMYIAEKEYSQAVSVVLDGFSRLDGINDIRTKISDLLLNIGTATNDRDLIGKAVWEGFVSSADLPHFINICNLSDENTKDDAIAYLATVQGKCDDRNYIRFLYGDYASVYFDCVSDKKFLGWSTSEKGRMIPLFVALLAGVAGEKVLSPCMKKLIESNFPRTSIKEDFFQVLTKNYKHLPEAEWKKYLDWCIKEAAGRVDAIVGDQHRGSYYKASVLVVSLAEVMRSAGDKAGAEKFIIGYKEKYPRHSSFRACLKQDIGLAKFGKLF